LLDHPQGGLGIGLTLVKSLAEMHQGNVRAYSEGLGRGSEFVVRLPSPKTPAAPAPQEAGEGAGPSESLRILVVEDNPDSRETLRLLLQLWGHRVEVAEDGTQGVHRALALRPDVGLI